ncbi:Fc.00g044690.m01.CDS01 [Cosmosporella sp. VM-42]
MSTSETRLFQLEDDVKINAIISRPRETTLPSASLLPALVFLHFWGGSSSTWSAVNASLSPNYTTVAIDFRGWGGSIGPAKEDAYSIAHLANDVEAVVKSLELAEFALIGLSMGAKVAQLVAGRGHLDGLKGLILVSPAPPTPMALPEEMREQQVHAYDGAGSADFVAKNVLTASSPSESTIQLLVEDMLRGNQWARAAWPSYAMAEDVSHDARNIKCPVLVVASGKDVVEPLERVQKEVCRSIPDTQLEVLETSGHLSPIDDAPGLVNHISKFVKGL